jgi:catechol 2,3-dioxygenase
MTQRSEVYFGPAGSATRTSGSTNCPAIRGSYNEICGLTVEFWEPDLVATFLGTGNTPHDLGFRRTGFSWSAS